MFQVLQSYWYLRLVGKGSILLDQIIYLNTYLPETNLVFF